MSTPEEKLHTIEATIQRGVRAMHECSTYFNAYQLWRNVAMRRQADFDGVHIEACKERDEALGVLVALDKLLFRHASGQAWFDDSVDKQALAHIVRGESE